MQVKRTHKAAEILLCLVFSSSAAWAKVDRAALYKHLPKALPFPPGVEFDLKDVRPSPIPGLLSGTLEGRYKGQAQSWPIQITEDGRYYILSDVYALGPSKIPGLLSAAGDAAAPQVHVTKNGTRFLVGEIHDVRVDPDKANMSKVRLQGAPFRGAANAPVVLVEYSDLECPYCRNAHQTLEKELLPAYGGKVRWIFKHNPLVHLHLWAYNAAIAAACAARMKPEAGWQLEADFFNAQPDPKAPAAAQQAVEQAILSNIRAMSLDFAQKAGLDKARFQACYDKQESKDIVEADRREAEALHLDSTPAFLVNGRIVRGFRDFTELKTVIDAMLAEKSR